MRYPIGSDSAAFSAEISAIMAETALCRDNSRLSTQIKLSGPQLPFRVFSPWAYRSSMILRLWATPVSGFITWVTPSVVSDHC